MPIVPAIPGPDADLPRAVAERLAADLDAWSATTASALFDLESEAKTFGTDAQRADVAAAFVLWQAVSGRIDAWDGAASFDDRRRAETLRSMWSPVMSASGETVAPHLADAMVFLAALVDRVAGEVRAAQAHAAEASTAWLEVDRNLRDGARLAGDLGEEVRHASELAAEAGRCHRAEAPPADLARRAADLATRLAQSDDQRHRVLAELEHAEDGVAQLMARESTVRTLAAACREKICDAPNLAVPSVAALRPPPVDATTRPWPAVRADAESWLHTRARVAAALDEAERRFGAPVARRDELRGLLQAFRDKAASAGLAEHEAVDPLYTGARDTLWTAPCDLADAERQVARYVATVNEMMNGAM